MNSLSVFTTIFAFLFVISSRGADVIPKRSDFGRYQAMLEHSPFAVATASALPAATPSFAKDLYIANAARSPDGDLVTLASVADKNFKEYLTTKAPNERGYAIASIEWSDKVGATKVTVSKDGQFASVTFNQALISSGLPTGPLPQQPANTYQPGQGQVPTSVTRPTVPAPTIPTPPPRVRGVIPRNPNAAGPTPIAVPPPTSADE